MTFEEQTEDVPLTPQEEARLHQASLDHARVWLQNLAAAVGEDETFSHLPSAALAAWYVGQLDDAKRLAERTLALAPAHSNNWNYGNAIHLGHTVLGLFALREGDPTAAITRLRCSGQTPGSPQLVSFGPSMLLARELLKVGHVEAVLAYLAQCRVFWESGGKWLDLWERMVRAGRLPNFTFFT